MKVVNLIRYKVMKNSFLIIALILVFHQMLVANQVIESWPYFNIAATIFILMQGLLLVYNHQKVYSKAKRLSQELKKQRDRVGQQAEKLKEASEQLLAFRTKIPTTKQLCEEIPLVLFQPTEASYSVTELAFMEKLLELLEQHHKDETFSPDQISDFFKISKRQLNRKLKQTMDSTATKLLQNFRLYKAKELLHDRALRIGEISYMVGFSSQSYFNRMFKDRFSLTPKEYQVSLGKIA